MTTKGKAVDMSPAALARRLEQVRALYKLMLHLRQARPVEPPTEPPEAAGRHRG